HRHRGCFPLPPSNAAVNRGPTPPGPSTPVNRPDGRPSAVADNRPCRWRLPVSSATSGPSRQTVTPLHVSAKVYTADFSHPLPLLSGRLGLRRGSPRTGTSGSSAPGADPDLAAAVPYRFASGLAVTPWQSTLRRTVIVMMVTASFDAGPS